MTRERTQGPLPWWFAVERVWTPIITSLGIIGGLLGVAGYLSESNRMPQAPAAAVNLSLIVALLGSFVAFAFFRWRRERYAEITPYLEAVADRCRMARSRLSVNPTEPDKELARLINDLEQVLNDVATIFSILRGVRCRCALKTFFPTECALRDANNDPARIPPEEWFVWTFARDTTSALSNRNTDGSRADAEFDTLDKNPHLLELFSEDVDGEDWACFLDVRKQIARASYTSSSLLWRMKQSHSLGHGGGPHTLSYQSALVALVRGTNAPRAFAFVGVDCDKRNGFIGRHDGPLLVSIAGHIGPLMQDAWGVWMTRGQGPAALNPSSASSAGN